MSVCPNVTLGQQDYIVLYRIVPYRTKERCVREREWEWEWERERESLDHLPTYLHVPNQVLIRYQSTVYQAKHLSGTMHKYCICTCKMQNAKCNAGSSSARLFNIFQGTTHMRYFVAAHPGPIPTYALLRRLQLYLIPDIYNYASRIVHSILYTIYRSVYSSRYM